MMIINSPGGDGLAAERIINICRSYSNDRFEVIVPKKAKSAATMICMGASKILMSKTAELGPIDPQIVRGKRLVSAHNIIKSYEELLENAINTKGNLEPYLQQLQRYDAAEIVHYKTLQALTKDIATRALSTGMLKAIPSDEIERKIEVFLDPERTSSHGRPINIEAAVRSGLNVEEIKLTDEIWPLVWELYIRADWCMADRCSKLVETRDHSFRTPRISRRSS